MRLVPNAVRVYLLKQTLGRIGNVEDLINPPDETEARNKLCATLATHRLADPAVVSTDKMVEFGKKNQN